MSADVMVNFGFSAAYGPGSQPAWSLIPGQVPWNLPVYSATPLGDPAFSAPWQVYFGPSSSLAFSGVTLAIAVEAQVTSNAAMTSRFMFPPQCPARAAASGLNCAGDIGWLMRHQLSPASLVR